MINRRGQQRSREEIYKSPESANVRSFFFFRIPAPLSQWTPCLLFWKGRINYASPFTVIVTTRYSWIDPSAKRESHWPGQYAINSSAIYHLQARVGQGTAERAATQETNPGWWYIKNSTLVPLPESRLFILPFFGTFPIRMGWVLMVVLLYSSLLDPQQYRINSTEIPIDPRGKTRAKWELICWLFHLSRSRTCCWDIHIEDWMDAVKEEEEDAVTRRT